MPIFLLSLCVEQLPDHVQSSSVVQDRDNCQADEGPASIPFHTALIIIILLFVIILLIITVLLLCAACIIS